MAAGSGKKRISAFPGVVSMAARTALLKTAMKIQEHAKNLSPVDTGLFRASFQLLSETKRSEMFSGDGGAIVQQSVDINAGSHSVVSNVFYGEYIDQGSDTIEAHHILAQLQVAAPEYFDEILGGELSRAGVA